MLVRIQLPVGCGSGAVTNRHLSLSRSSNIYCMCNKPTRPGNPPVSVIMESNSCKAFQPFRVCPSTSRLFIGFPVSRAGSLPFFGPGTVRRVLQHYDAQLTSSFSCCSSPSCTEQRRSTSRSLDTRTLLFRAVLLFWGERYVPLPGRRVEDG